MDVIDSESPREYGAYYYLAKEPRYSNQPAAVAISHHQRSLPESLIKDPVALEVSMTAVHTDLWAAGAQIQPKHCANDH